MVGDTGWAVLRVVDRGPGIPTAVRTQLLERFARGTAFQGLGLGLSLVRGIAEAHGGAVSLGATPGGATTVELSLSLCAARPRGSKPQPVAAPGAGSIEPRAAHAAEVGWRGSSRAATNAWIWAR